MKPLLPVILAFLMPQSAGACRIDISLDAHSGRVAGFAVTVPHAATEVAALPSGWKISVNNEPGWATTVDAHAIVGAAFLSSTDVLAMLRFKPEPGFSCEALGKAPSTAVTITFYRRDRLMHSQIGKEHLSFVP